MGIRSGILNCTEKHVSSVTSQLLGSGEIDYLSKKDSIFLRSVAMGVGKSVGSSITDNLIKSMNNKTVKPLVKPVDNNSEFDNDYEL